MREKAYYDFVRAFFVRAFIIKSALLETGHVSRSQIVCLVSERYNTTVILSAKNSNLLVQKGNKELKNIDNWLIANKLSLNINETKYMIFSISSSNRTQKKSLLTIRGKPIDRVISIKLVGVIFNEHLTWKDHMKMLLSKFKSCLYCLMRVKPYLTNNHY